MESLYNGFTLNTPVGTFPLSTDSMALADFIRLPKNARVLDLGSGCGTLGILLCAKDSTCTVTGYEIDPISHSAAQDNIQRNKLNTRMNSICAPIQAISRDMPAGSVDVCISNPPYFSGGAASTQTPYARRNDFCTAEDLLAAAAWALRFGGDFYLVHKPENLALLCACASSHQMEAKKLCLVRHRPESGVAMILLQLRKGGKPGLTWEELNLHDETGEPTSDYRRIYHI